MGLQDSLSGLAKVTNQVAKAYEQARSDSGSIFFNGVQGLESVRVRVQNRTVGQVGSADQEAEEPNAGRRFRQGELTN